MNKKLTAFRLNQKTLGQLEELKDLLTCNRTKVLFYCIDLAHELLLKNELFFLDDLNDIVEQGANGTKTLCAKKVLLLYTNERVYLNFLRAFDVYNTLKNINNPVTGAGGLQRPVLSKTASCVEPPTPAGQLLNARGEKNGFY